MKVLWLINPVVARHLSPANPEQGVLACPSASARLRMGVAALEVRRAGGENLYLDPAAGTEVPAAEVCVVTKFFPDSPLSPWTGVCSTARRKGARLVVDITDFPFHKRPPAVVQFYDGALKDCAAVTVNSARMGELIAPRASRAPTVIEDAVLSPPGEPAFAPGEPLRLLWFGHPQNLHFLRDGLDALARFALQRRCELAIVTGRGHGAEELAQEIGMRCAPALEARFIEWSLSATTQALRGCDLVLIPSDPENPLKTGASSNRLAEAINAGRLAVASPLASYAPYSGGAWLGKDLVEGVKWALTNGQEALARIRKGQALVTQKLAAAPVGRQWRELFEGLA